jgi:hypothetical protein
MKLNRGAAPDEERKILPYRQLIILGCGLFLSSWIAGCDDPRSASSPALPDPLTSGDPMANTPFISEGIENPRFVTAEEFEGDLDEEIVGVEFEGEVFAFPLARLSGMRDHVVNHVIVGEEHSVPLTVTYCDATECIRVMTADGATESLKVSTLGRSQGELQLQYRERSFLQNATEIPLDDVAFERTTLRDWLAEHSAAKIYAGRPAGPP